MSHFLGENEPFSRKPYIFSIFAPMNDVLMNAGYGKLNARASGKLRKIMGFLMEDYRRD